ncbi:IclR family transcriptional regulator [Stutzerimonas stutzeri]|uniref:IclR family transcriptional regulator n=1 Tax=Stutzerimonas stutzeri TaxID=316 RepID=UPI00210C9D22|nr:IclR family transcriptional regulator [Stutzerimonas stutzeri]MCQ4322168.1 IclR family transcriptional regulator [Stutzerimonas stutzeri]
MNPTDNAEKSIDGPADAADPLFNQSLAKGLLVLHAFDLAHRTLTLGEVARLTDMSKGSAQRAVHTLEILGYIGRDERSRRFRLLPKVVELGFNYLASHALVRLAHPYLAQLAQASGETASLTEPVGHHMLYVAQILTTQSIPVLTPVGMRIPMYCTSSGRAYLGCLGDNEARRILEASAREPRTPTTLTRVEDILHSLQTSRRLGYAVNCEELFLGDMGIAAPIIDRFGQAVGAVHLSPPTSRWSLEEATSRLAPLVLECARSISESLAH